MPVNNSLQLRCGTHHPHMGADVGFNLVFWPQSKAASLLVWPMQLAHEHTPVSLVTNVLDVRNLQTLALWLALAWLVWYCCMHPPHCTQARRVFALALIVVCYLPASHVRGWCEWRALFFLVCVFVFVFVFVSGLGCSCGVAVSVLRDSCVWCPVGGASQMLFSVAFVVAERTLFLPSLGVSILVVDVLSSTVQSTLLLTRHAMRAFHGHMGKTHTTSGGAMSAWKRVLYSKSKARRCVSTCTVRRAACRVCTCLVCVVLTRNWCGFGATPCATSHFIVLVHVIHTDGADWLWAASSASLL